MDFVEQVGLGFISGLTIAAAGYFKANEKFEALKFIRTTWIGGMVGGTAALLGVEASAVESMPIYMGITIFTDYLIMGLYKRKSQIKAFLHL